MTLADLFLRLGAFAGGVTLMVLFWNYLTSRTFVSDQPIARFICKHCFRSEIAARRDGCLEDACPMELIDSPGGRRALDRQRRGTNPMPTHAKPPAPPNPPRAVYGCPCGSGCRCEGRAL